MNARLQSFCNLLFCVRLWGRLSPSRPCDWSEFQSSITASASFSFGYEPNGRSVIKHASSFNHSKWLILKRLHGVWLGDWEKGKLLGYRKMIDGLAQVRRRLGNGNKIQVFSCHSARLALTLAKTQVRRRLGNGNKKQVFLAIPLALH